MATSITPPSTGASVTPPDDFDSSLDSAFAGTEAVTSETEALTSTGDDAEPETPESPESEEIVDPEADEEATQEDEPNSEEELAEEAKTEEDPDVKPGEHKGKKGFFLTENRYRTFEGAHKSVQEIERVLNEPLTKEAVQRDHAAFMGQEQMYADFLSGEPQAHQKFIQNFVSEARRALEEGDAPADAMVSFASQLPSALEKMHPEAHSVLMTTAMRKAIDDLLPVARAAVVPGDPNSKALLYSLQHIEKKLFNGNFTKENDIKLPDPNAQRQSRERSAVDELNQLRSQQATESWNRWQKSTNEGIQGAVDEAISTAIDSLFEKAPKALAALKKANNDQYTAQIDRLNSEIKKEFKSNAELRRAIQVELRNAKIAASEEKRGLRSEAIVNRHAFAAKRVIQQFLPDISRKLNAAAKGALDGHHAKRAAAQQNRAPSGSGGEVRTSLVPPKNPATGRGWNPDDFAAHVDRLLS